MTLPALTIGDKLILRRLQGRVDDTEVIVYKIGRKWGYAKPEGKTFPDVKFDLETGHEDSGQHASRARVLTATMDDAEKRHKAALATLKSHGLTFEWSAAHKVSAETVEALVAVMEAKP